MSCTLVLLQFIFILTTWLTLPLQVKLSQRKPWLARSCVLHVHVTECNATHCCSLQYGSTINYCLETISQVCHCHRSGSYACRYSKILALPFCTTLSIQNYDLQWMIVWRDICMYYRPIIGCAHTCRSRTSGTLSTSTERSSTSYCVDFFRIFTSSMCALCFTYCNTHTCTWHTYNAWSTL